MALNVVSTDRLSTNVKTSNLATGLSEKVGENKNLIINGACNVAQRSSQVTDDGYQTVDRFRLQYGGSDNHLTQAQHALTSSDTGPWAKGFRNSFHVTNGDQTSGAGASDYTQIVQKIEAQNIANSGWDYTSASSYVTLSFWIKASVAQTYYCNLETNDGTAQLYSFSTGALSADTWTKVTKTIPGNSNITVNNDNGIGLILIINAFLGTTYTTSGHTLNQWAAAGSFGDMAPDMTSTWWTTNDATFEITGVQLEVGDTATEFEHRSYGEELARCQRYYYITDPTTDAFAGGGGYFMYDTGATTTGYGSLTFAQTMRAAPTIVLRDNAGNTDGKATQHGNAHDIAATAADINENGFSRIMKSSGNWGTGAGKPIICGCTATAEL